MLIEYVGHACFYLVNREGVRIIVDPYDASVGLAPVKKEADVALVTHRHYDHANLQAVSGEYTLVDGPGEYAARGVSVTGLSIPHDDAGGQKFGMVTAYLVKTDGMSVLHMGDAGAMPGDDFFDAVGKVDILMVPIGGLYTVDAAGAIAIMDRIDPNIIIPMHFKTRHLTLEIESAHRFLKLAQKNYDISRLGGNEFEIGADNLKKRGRVLMMENSFAGDCD